MPDLLPRKKIAIIASICLLLTTSILFAEESTAASSGASSTILIIAYSGLGVLAIYVLSLIGLTVYHFFYNPAPVPEEIIRKKKPVPAPASMPTFTTADGQVLPLNPQMTRRSFITLLGWAWIAFTAATMGALTTVLRFFFPNVTFEPPLKFKVGFPDQFAVGVDERFKNEHRVWIVRNDKGFYALSTICTHLGCTPNWLQTEQKFKCPCHGSGFYVTGVNFEGPAPRPLERFQIALADDGQIEVDEGVKFQQELGQWGMPGSFLEYKG